MGDECIFRWDDYWFLFAFTQKLRNVMLFDVVQHVRKLADRSLKKGNKKEEVPKVSNVSLYVSCLVKCMTRY